MAKKKVGKTPKTKPPQAEPFGYGAYSFIHRLLHPGVTMLSPKGYRPDPLRAYETALGVKPRPVVQNLRRRRYGLPPIKKR